MTQELYESLVIEFGEMKHISANTAAKIIIQAVRDFTDNLKQDQEIRDEIALERANKKAKKEGNKTA